MKQEIDNLDCIEPNICNEVLEKLNIVEEKLSSRIAWLEGYVEALSVRLQLLNK